MKKNNLLLTVGFALGLACSAHAQNERPAQPVAQPATPAPVAAVTTTDTNQAIRLNFRGVPLEMVLNHLSEAAGFIVLLETEIKGNVDVWSNQPLDKEEAVQLLNSILNEKGYAAIRNGRLLRIVDRKDAKKRDLPVQSGAKPADIEKSDEMITQIIPVRYANATQMTRDLSPLLPDYATLTANESGNALVLTDTKANVRRMAEIVAALDTSISSISTIRVFPLRFADAKELAAAVKELFQTPQQNNNNNNQRNRFRGGPGSFFLGGGGGGGGGNGGGGGGEGAAGDTGNSAAREAASRVVAVADERNNSLIVAAPDEYIPTIEDLVLQIDVQANDITELRVFQLKNADPVELATIFSQLFPDETRTGTQGNNNGNDFRFGGFPGGGGGGGRRQNNTANAESSRLKKMGKVSAVPDQRTSSLIVSAASELMPQIEQMVAQLDSSSARKQKVYVYSLENADVQQVEQILQGMFQRNTTSQYNRNNQNQNSALNSRSQNTQTTIGGQASGVRTGNNNNNNNNMGRTR